MLLRERPYRDSTRAIDTAQPSLFDVGLGDGGEADNPGDQIKADRYLHEGSGLIIPAPGLIAGFTGPRLGINSVQREKLTWLFSNCEPCTLHHGDCIGADTEAHMIAVGLCIPEIIIHPPIYTKYRSYCDQKHVGLSKITVLPPREYVARDKDTVDQSDYLVATPNSEMAQKGSGTWTTIRYARQKNKPIWHIFPDGRMWVDS